MAELIVTTFYKFTPLTGNQIQKLQKKLRRFGTRRKMRGLTLLAEEGINSTVSGGEKAIAKWKKLIQKYFGNVAFKDSTAQNEVFKRWFVKVREEIVQLGDASVVPESEENNHLEPAEWHRVMQEEDVIVLDTRNDYETKIGVFKNAVDPKLRQFQDFPAYVQNSGIPKDKKVLMYCTGGIRCEKALIEMKNQGYKHVYQLKGGILQYLQEFPNGLFEGECFVFDHRASVNQNLEPSSLFTLCPHCGDPGKEHVSCKHCGKEGIVCDVCLLQKRKEACSKDCAFRIEHKKIPLHQGMR